MATQGIPVDMELKKVIKNILHCVDYSGRTTVSYVISVES